MSSALGVPEGYKMTEVGVIPGDWEVVKLGSIADILIGLTYSPSDVCESGTLVLRSSNIQKEQLSFEDNVYIQMDLPDRVITREGDILICVRNGSRQLIGKAALIDKATAGSAFGAFMGLLRTESSQFIFHQFKSEILKRQISDGMGATINQITNKDMAAFNVVWPPSKTEQQAIAEVLSDADALVESLEQLLVKKRQIKQGAMQELLTGQMRLPGFHAEWEMKMLGEVAPLQRGFDLPNSQMKQGIYPVVASNGIINHHLVFQVSGPGVVTGRSGTIGNVSYIESDFWPHNTALWVTSFKGNDPKFVFYLYIYIGFEKFATGSGVPTLNRNDVHAFRVNIPATKAEQTAIATILSTLDSDIAALQSQLVKARQIKQGMAQELLTGRIRLVSPAIPQGVPA